MKGGGKLNLQVLQYQKVITCGLSMNHPLASVFCSCKKGLDAFSIIFTGCLCVGRQTYLKWFEGDIQWPEARDSTAGVG